jgi:hypothetical protein
MVCEATKIEKQQNHPNQKKKNNMAEREMKVTQEQMSEARLDLAYRDYCAHLLIPLNRCRRRTVSFFIFVLVLFFLFLKKWLLDSFLRFCH